MHPVFTTDHSAAIPIYFVTSENQGAIRDRLDPRTRGMVQAMSFEPKPGRHLLLANEDALSGVLFGLEPPNVQSDPFLPGRLPELLPAGTFRFGNEPPNAKMAALAFALGAYRFTRYRKSEMPNVRLALADGDDAADLSRIAEGTYLARDLINTPANDLGPEELEAETARLANRHGARIGAITGRELADGFPLIHAVGSASPRAPRLIDMIWGRADAPKVTIVGKGVCFDTGGLDIKTASSMLIMKKDMGGAACALALAHMAMDRKLDIRLRVLIPAVENVVAGASFRPLDIYRSRKGLTVEIGNTDAEGRLVLADALALADEEKPDLLVDFATLTGAARVALGPDLPPFYTDDDQLALDLARHGRAENDPVWRMPLWRPYAPMLDSKTADINNVSTSGHAGSITAALFLNRFVEAAKSWLHLDVFAWTPSAKSGRPEGGECQAARALYALLCERYRG